MKKLQYFMLTTLFCISLGSPVIANTKPNHYVAPSKQAQQKIKQAIKLYKILGKTNLRALGNMLKIELLKALPIDRRMLNQADQLRLHQHVNTVINKLMTSNSTKNFYVSFFATHYTLPELKTLNKYWSSNTGQSIAKKMIISNARFNLFNVILTDLACNKLHLKRTGTLKVLDSINNQYFKAYNRQIPQHAKYNPKLSLFLFQHFCHIDYFDIQTALVPVIANSILLQDKNISSLDAATTLAKKTLNKIQQQPNVKRQYMQLVVFSCYTPKEIAFFTNYLKTKIGKQVVKKRRLLDKQFQAYLCNIAQHALQKLIFH